MFASALSILLAASTASPSCESVVGQTINPLSFDQVWSSLPAAAPQGKYESDAAFKARSESKNNSPVWIVNQKPVQMWYDKKAGKLTVSPYEINQLPHGIWSGLLVENISLPTLFLDGMSFNIKGPVSGKSWIGTNAFGASTTVGVEYYSRDIVFDIRGKKAMGLEVQVPGRNSELDPIQLDIEPAQIKSVAETSRAVFYIIPKQRFRSVPVTVDTHNATLNEAYDTRDKINRIMAAEIKCVGLINPQNQIFFSGIAVTE